MAETPLGEAASEALSALLERLIPGAVDAGVQRFVEREAAGHAGLYADGLARLVESGFAQLGSDGQERLLRELEGGDFFELVRLHAIMGMFGDPAHGGNAGGAGWALLGYPGPKAEWSAEEQQAR